MSTTSSMIRYNTVFESTQNLPFTFAIGHGESVDLVASITNEGNLVELSGYTARAIYQPKSKFGTDEWYECPCEKVENTVVVHWTNIQDNGDNAVILWLHFMKDGKVAYPALYKFRLFETPGFQPSAITVIPDTLDFSMYTLVNAPWVLPETLSAYATIESLNDYATIDSLKYTLLNVGINENVCYLRDRCINIPSYSGSVTTITTAVSAYIPENESGAGYARDFLANITLGTGGSIVFYPQSGETISFMTEDGSWPDMSAGNTYLVRFTEINTGVFLVQSQTIETATQGGAQ